MRAGTVTIAMAAVLALCAGGGSAQQPVEVMAVNPCPVTRFVLLPPTVEYVDFRTGQTMATPPATGREMHRTIAERIERAFAAGGFLVTVWEAADTFARVDWFDALRRTPARLDTAQRTELTRLEDAQALLTLRVRFTVDADALDPRALQLMSEALFGKFPAARMVVDARAYRGISLAKAWKALVQERVGPRRAAAGLDRAAARIAQVAASECLEEERRR